MTIAKTASLPPLRVAPELRRSAEDVLAEGETLSAFVEEAVRLNIERRRAEQDFVARGLASAERARQTGQYFSADEVIERLRARLARHRKDMAKASSPAKKQSRTR